MKSASLIAAFVLSLILIPQHAIADACDDVRDRIIVAYPGFTAERERRYNDIDMHTEKFLENVTLYCPDENRAAMTVTIWTNEGWPKSSFKRMAARVASLAFAVPELKTLPVIERCFAAAKSDKRRNGVEHLNNASLLCGLSEESEAGESNLIFSVRQRRY